MSISLSFPYTLEPTGVVSPADTTAKIYLDRVVTLLSTNLGQRPMYPTYGVDWSTSFFENDNVFKPAVAQAIKTAIATWLPEITVLNIDITNETFEGTENVLLTVGLPNNTTATLSVNTNNFTGNTAGY